MLYAHLRHSGALPADIVNTRAIVSVAWVAGPPLATFIIGWFGNRAILLAIAAVAVLNVATTAIMITTAEPSPGLGRRRRIPSAPRPGAVVGRSSGIVLIMAAFVLLQAANATGMTIMTIYVTETLQLDVLWPASPSGSPPRSKYPP